MKERSIICRAHEVRAILDGRQTQIRRPISRLVWFGPITEFQRSETSGYDWQFRDKRQLWNDIDHRRLIQCSPYGAGGDKLWGRETFCDDWADSRGIQYRADGGLDGDMVDAGCKWRSSIQMPRLASRITLEVTGVRVERLQEISEADALPEGVSFNPVMHTNPREAFMELWKQINGPGSWDANPYVWAIEFKRVKP